MLVAFLKIAFNSATVKFTDEDLCRSIPPQVQDLEDLEMALSRRHVSCGPPVDAVHEINLGRGVEQGLAARAERAAQPSPPPLPLSAEKLQTFPTSFRIIHGCTECVDLVKRCQVSI